MGYGSRWCIGSPRRSIGSRRTWAAYADTARLHVHGAKISIEWDYVEDPHRVGAYRLSIAWPAELPEGRRKALLRAAEQCTVHATLQHPPTIVLAVE